MSISKDVIKQCLISKQREVDEAVIVNRIEELINTSDLLKKVEIRRHLEITQILFGYLLDLH